MRALAFLVWCFATLASPTAADLLLYLDSDGARYRGSELIQSDQLIDCEKVWLADGRARLDKKYVTYILDKAAGRMLLIDHREKSYSVFDLPVDIMPLFDEGTRKQIGTLDEKIEVEKSALADEEQVGRWKVRGYHVVATANGSVPKQLIDATYWVSETTPPELALYKEIMASRDALSPTTSQWMDEIHGLEGMIVRWTKKRLRDGGVTEVVTQTLTSILEVEPEEGRFSPPGDYEHVPVDPASFFYAGPPKKYLGGPRPKP